MRRHRGASRYIRVSWNQLGTKLTHAQAGGGQGQRRTADTRIFSPVPTYTSAYCRVSPRRHFANFTRGPKAAGTRPYALAEGQSQGQSSVAHSGRSFVTAGG